jgi:hypothetical protein
MRLTSQIRRHAVPEMPRSRNHSPSPSSRPRSALPRLEGDSRARKINK